MLQPAVDLSVGQRGGWEWMEGGLLSADPLSSRQWTQQCKILGACGRALERYRDIIADISCFLASMRGAGVWGGMDGWRTRSAMRVEETAVGDLCGDFLVPLGGG